MAFDQDGHASDKIAFFKQVAGAWGPMRRSPAELAEWYQTAPRDWYEPDAGVVELLADMTSADLVWGIVTNGPPTQLEKARLMQVDTGAKCIVISDVHGVAKPDPAIFLEALQLLGSPSPGEVLFAGDNPEADVGGARNVGMAAAWSSRGREWPDGLAPPDFTFKSVLETRGLLGI